MIRSDDTGHLKNIVLLAKIMLIISPTTAECVRRFSQLNLIKTDKRTSMEYDSLAFLLRIKIDDSSLKDYEAGPPIVHWR
ncbi:hypothetical protein DPMN_110810 [Dreissena polymorpha]|uniref:HAT C-terminal dimerisation domain-containing protein n=1 Tax=Dreissena polymorpha TaxID=45954 RepID=A0A9D4QN88_DREPO|nr:hypothetical protein DPMN_110810 [Dreissena polymorpha]